MGVDDDAEGEGAVDQGQTAYCREDGRLLAARAVGETDKLGGAAEIGLGPGGRHFTQGLAPADQRPGVDGRPGLDVDRHRFPGQHGLVDHHRTFADSHIRRHHRSQRQPDGIAGHELRRRPPGPLTVAAYQSDWRQLLLEGGERGARPILLEKPEAGVEREEPGDHRRLERFAEPDLKDDCGLEHPGDGGPEFGEKDTPSRRRTVRDRIRPDLGQPARGLGARQARCAVSGCDHLREPGTVAMPAVETPPRMAPGCLPSRHGQRSCGRLSGGGSWGARRSRTM